MPDDHSPAPTAERVVVYDWVRTLSVLSLLFYHPALIFAADRSWIVRDAAARAWVGELAGMLFPWRMPLMFLVAGASTTFMLRRRAGGAYLRDRLRRLVPGFACTLLLMAPVQRYAEAYAGERPRVFVRHAWRSLLDGGAPHWYHLWFVPTLLAITVLALLARQVVRLAGWAGALHRRAVLVERPQWLLAGAVAPVALAVVPVRVLDRLNVVPGVGVGDLLFFGIFFAVGVFFGRFRGALPAATRVRHVAAAAFLLSMGPATLIGALALRGVDLGAVSAFGVYFPVAEALGRPLRSAGAWYGTVAVLGYAARHLRRGSAWLEYVRDAAFPTYLVHQNVIVLLGLVMLGWHVPGALKYALNVLATVASCLLFYELVARRYRVTRLLFGIPDRAAPTVRGPIEAWLRAVRSRLRLARRAAARARLASTPCES